MSSSSDFLKNRKYKNEFVRDFIRNASAKTAVKNNPFVPFSSIHIHPTNICNAKCVFCPYTQNTERKTVMCFDVFKETIDQYVSVGGDRIYFTPNAGDPLVDPNLDRKLSYARNAGIQYIGLVTNGILLAHKEIFRRVLPNLDNIGISLPGFESDSYRRLFKVDKAKKVLEGVLLLVDEKKKNHLHTQILLLLRIDRPLNEVMEDAGMQTLQPYLDDGTIEIDDDDILVEVDDWGGQIKQEDLTGIMTLKEPRAEPLGEPCSRLLSDMAVLPDGTVRVCACRYIETNYDDLVIGKVGEDKIEDLFLGPKHREILLEVERGNWPKVCQTCNWYTPIEVSD